MNETLTALIEAAERRDAASKGLREAWSNPTDDAIEAHNIQEDMAFEEFVTAAFVAIPALRASLARIGSIMESGREDA